MKPQRKLGIGCHIAEFIQHPDADCRHVIGILFRKLGMAEGDLQMKRRAGTAGDGFHHFPIFNSIEAPDGGFAAPVAHILAVEGHAVLKTHLIANHGITHPGHVCLGHPRQAVPGGGIQRLFQELRLGLFKTLLGLQQFTDGIRQNHGTMGQSREIALFQC